MLIRALAVALALSTIASAKDYENFSLPQKAMHSVPTEAKSFRSDKVQLRGSVPRLKQPGVDVREYLFAKEAFLAEKRDQAIKLLRQELDSGYKANRDNMLLRLGQLYAEKYMELSYRENELYTAQLQEYQKQPKGQKAPTLDTARSKRYLNDSLSLFYGLEKEYPRHPKMDEILFFIGFVEAESGHPDKGIRYLERVIRNYPRSSKYDEAIIYLADYLFEKQKFRDAYAKYRILLARPRSDVYHYAKYKIAWCELNTNQQRKALMDMRLLVDSLQGTEDKAKFNLREQAIKDLVIFFAEVEAVDEAIQYYSDRLPREKMLENLRLIADILRSKAKDAAAVKAYTRLVDEYPDSQEAPLLLLGIYDSLSRLGRQDQAVNTLLRALERYGASSDWAKKFPKEKEKEIATIQAQLQTETEKAALFLHQSAQKSQNKINYNYALRLYTALLAAFPNHPSKKSIAFYRAEILFQQQKWLEAANAYMDGAKVPPKDKMTDESVYNALLALERLTEKQDKITRFSKEDQAKVSTEKKEIPVGEKRFIEVAEFYIKEYPQGQRIVDVKFRIAAIYYRYHHFDEALVRFKDIALTHPKTRSAPTAAHIVLDILNIKKDYDTMNDTAGVFAGTAGLGDAEFKQEMAQISSEIGFKKVETLEGQSKWAEAAESYMKVYRSNPNGPLSEKSLYNAYVSYDKAGDRAKAAETSKLFISRYPKSEYTERLTLGLAKSAERQYEFEVAQRSYYDFYKKYPKNKEARKALYNAAVYAELLEQNQAALNLFNEYQKSGRLTEEEKKTIWVSEAKIYRKLGNWEKTTLAYRRLARDAGSLEAKLGILGELARVYEKGGRTADKANLIKEIQYLYRSAKGTKVTGPGVYYVGEAQFKSVERTRENYTKIPLRFPPEDLLLLMKRKQKALAKVAEEYDAVVEVGVPEWGIAALFEKGDAYDHFVKTYRGVVIPNSFKGDIRVEAEKSIKAIDDSQVKPLEAKAQEIYKACADRAAQFKVASEYTVKCRSRIKGDATPAPLGLAPAPNYWSTKPPSEEVASK